MNAHHTEEHAGQSPLVIDLVRAAALGASEIGSKAANLARLAGAEFPVPSGLVVTPAAEGEWEAARPRMLEAATDLGASGFAVLSSVTADDLEGAFFSDQYATIHSYPLELLPAPVNKLYHPDTV